MRHKHEERVKLAMSLPKHLQAFEFEKMRKDGMFGHNMKMLKEKKTLLCERGQMEDGVKICTQCKAFVRRRYFFSHSKNCGKKNGIQGTKRLAATLINNDTDGLEFTDLLSRFSGDRIGKFCEENDVIKLIGRSQFNKHKRKKDKLAESRKAVMCKMRTLANLYFHFISYTNDKTLPIEEMFRRQNFPALEEAIQSMTTHEDGTLKAGLKVSVGNLLKLSAKVVKGSYLIGDDDSSADLIDKFVDVLELKWISIFGDAEYLLLQNRNHKQRDPGKLPDEDAVKKIRNYTVDKLQQIVNNQYDFFCPETFVFIRDLTVSRLTLFNARRGGEPCRLQMSDWCDAKTEKWIDSQRAKYVNDAEKKLLSIFKIMYQGGKGTNRMVPVLVPPDCDSALDMLANSEIRKDSDINIRNMFLFPSTKQFLDHCSGWHSVKNVVDAAGVDPHITATAMRHRASTLYASLEISEDQRLVFFKHIGHTEDINKNVYQCPLGIQEVTKVGSYFASLDGMQVEGTEEPDITGDLEEGNSVEGESSGVSQTPGVEGQYAIRIGIEY
ncbi:uncharacterized protein LOC144432471 [Styela clava]